MFLEVIASAKTQMVLAGAAGGGVGSKAMKLTSISAYGWNIITGGLVAYFSAPGAQEILGFSDNVTIFATFFFCTPGIALIAVVIEFLNEYARLRKDQMRRKFDLDQAEVKPHD